MMNIRVAGLVNDSVVDGPGIRFTVFFQGCYHNCEKCHNPETHDLKGGYEISVEELTEKIKSNPLLDGVTFSGGEPFLQPEGFKILAEYVKQMNLHLIVYTGFLYEQIMADEQKRELLPFIDLLIDGKFEYKQKTLNLRFRGSANQRVIDVRRSLAENCVIEYDI